MYGVIIYSKLVIKYITNHLLSRSLAPGSRCPSANKGIKES